MNIKLSLISKALVLAIALTVGLPVLAAPQESLPVTQTAPSVHSWVYAGWGRHHRRHRHHRPWRHSGWHRHHHHHHWRWR